jgi:hypothetical protein
MFESSREHQAAVAQLAEAADLKSVQCRIVACLRHQSKALSSEAEHRFYIPRVEISKFSAPTNHRVFSSAEERVRDMHEAAGSSPARRTIHSSVAQQQSTRPISERSGGQHTAELPTRRTPTMSADRKRGDLNGPRGLNPNGEGAAF